MAAIDKVKIIVVGDSGEHEMINELQRAAPATWRHFSPQYTYNFLMQICCSIIRRGAVIHENRCWKNVADAFDMSATTYL